MSQLREVLSKIGNNCMNTQDDSPLDSTAETLRHLVGSSRGLLPNKEPNGSPGEVPRGQVIALKDRSPRGYYRQHTLFRFFDEIPQLFPFIKETTDEWLKPRGITLRKEKSAIAVTIAPNPQHNALEDLLPPKEHTDALISFYIDHVEKIHRVVHIPSFKREYSSCWIPNQPRHPAMTALILAMISISTPISTEDSTSNYRSMPPKWIAACDAWLAQHATKGRKLVYYQVACLVYLAKRINTIRKKRFWIETGSLVQNAMLDGLHMEEPNSPAHSPYVKETKRRIWAVVRELDLQNSFEYELPTLLHNLQCSITDPANVDDEEMENSTPRPKTLDHMTDISYQALSSRSWKLRLEISKRLFSTGTAKALPYDEVLQYTHRLTQALDSLPLWCKKISMDGSGAADSLLISALLQFQLKECILAIHRPYLQGGNSHSSLSEMICYHAARDVLLMNRELGKHGMQNLLFFREDLLVASLSLTRLSLNQPRGSTAVITADLESTIALLQQCYPFAEDRLSEKNDIFQTKSVDSAEHSQLPQQMDDYTNFDMDWTNIDIDWQSGAVWDMELPWGSP
ncbi:hypothetical protein INS49_007174 [Diaporthe citri]|uniref:uncharacterized protein n=1 Tax=Diaporthe citri TaxID=83186 RepID=UPI001C818616|nr:uncharacterized protein INS49_007174 [Diaporthe citri]KAG6365563.1 hypothetical protein INS49_007174 [Diaporthe citri]